MATRGKAAVEKRNERLERLRIEYARLDSVHPNSYNPNRQSPHDFRLLLKSMDEDGFTQPIVVQQDSREIVDGEHRWSAWIVLTHLRRNRQRVDDLDTDELFAFWDRRAAMLRDVGDEEIPIVLTPMSAEQMRIATLRHNRARGSEDIELAAQVLRDLRELGALDWAQDSLMLGDIELQRLLEDIPAPEALAAAEYGEAWEPSKHTESFDVGPATGNGPGVGEASEGQVTSMTTEASDALRRRERAIAEARTQEEREAARRDVQVYRVVVVFSGDEARDVKAVLGSTAADVILELCRERLASQPAAT